MAYRLGEPLDYEPAAIGDTEPEAPAAPAGAIPEPEEIPAVVIPKVTDIPKVVYEGEEKKKAEPTYKLGEALDYEPSTLPEPEGSKPNWVSNVGRGIGERSIELAGNVAGGIAHVVEGAGDWMDQTFGKPVWDEAGNISWRRMTPEETKGNQIIATKLLSEVQQGMKDPDLGYDPRTTWEDVKKAPLSSILPFAMEQGLVSAPDMAAAVFAPEIYVLEQTEEISTERAKNEGRTEPTFGDMIKSLPAATLSAMLEKFGTEKLFGVGDIALTELKQIPAELLKTLMTEGATEAAQQASQYAGEHAFTQKGVDWWEAAEQTLQAGMVGAIFGPAVRTATATAEVATSPGKKDEEDEDTIDEAGDTITEGVADENVDAAAASESATPGNLGASTPAPPAGVIPETPTAAPAPTAVDPTIAAGLATAGAGPATPTVTETSDIEEEVSVPAAPGEVDEGAAALAAATRDMYARETAAAAQEAAAATVKVADTNSDVVAALTEVTKGQKKAQRAARAQKETTGTGKALLTTPIVPPGQPAATRTAPEAAAPGIPPSPPVPPAAPVAAGPVPPTPPVAAATTRDERKAKLMAGAPEGLVAELDAAKAAAQPAVSLEPAPPAEIPVAPAGEIAAEPTVLPQGELPANVKLGEPLDYEPAPIPTEGAAAPTPVSVPTPGAKGAAVKEKALAPKQEKKPAAEPKPPKEKKPKAEAAKKVGKEKAAAPAAEVVKREDVAAWLVDRPKAEAAPAAPAEGAAPQTKMTRDAAAYARADPRVRKAIEESEATDSLATTEEVAAEVLHKHGRQGRSPREIIEGHVEEIVAEVERRLAKATETIQEERVAHEAVRDKKIDRSDEEAAVERKTKEMAAATAPQKKERAGKNKGKSPEGILTQADDSWLREEERQLKKKPEERDQRVMKYAQLVREEKKISTPERKKEIAAEKQAIKEAAAESRRAELEAKKTAPKELSPEAKARQAKVEEVLKAVPMPPQEGSLHSQEQAWKANLLKFVDAIKGIGLGKNIVQGNSNAENVAIWSRKLVANLKAEKKSEHFMDIYADGVAEYQMARYFESVGATEELNTLLGTEKIRGEEYQEGALGGDGVDVSELLDEGVAAVRSTEETAVPTTDIEGGGGILATGWRQRRGGRTGAQKRWLDRAIHVLDRDQGLQKNVTLPTNQGPVTVEAYITTGGKILNDIKSNGNEDLKDFDKEWGGFFSFFRDMHLKRLRDMVGDIPVYIVDDADMTKIMGGPGTGGVHMGYGNTAIAMGYQPYIVLNAMYVADDAAMAHVAIHEMTHAATIQAYKMNVRGTREIIRRLRQGVHQELRNRGMTAEDLRDLDLAYGLIQKSEETADLEFIAEAFSNPRFQAMLAQFNVNPRVARDIAALATKGRLPTWWEAFTATVSNAIGLIRGQRGQTYMEQMVAVHPHIMRGLNQQVREAERETYGVAFTDRERHSRSMLPRAVAQGPTDVLQFNAEFKQQFDGFKAKLGSGWPTVKTRGMLNMASTTGELQRKAAAIMGGFTNPFNKLAELVHKKDPLRKAYRAMGQPVEDRLIAFAKKNPKAYKAMSKFLHEAARLRIDPRHGLNHENNKGISKTGARSEQQRAAHARQAEVWAKLPAEAKALSNDLIEHYRKMHDMDSEKTIRLAFTNVFKAHHKDLPAGKTMEDAIEWVRSGAAARKLEERTAEDVQWHKALGSTAETLANIPHLRRLQGIYVPLSRRGKFFISGWEKLAKPAKAIIDPSVKGDNKNKFIFSNEKDAREYMASTGYLAKLTSRWIDPTTGERRVDPVTGKYVGKDESYVGPAGNLIHMKQQFFVTVQNNFMEMHDHQGQLDKRAEELRKQGHHVKASALTQEHIDRGGGDITTVEMQALLRNLRGTTIGTTTIGQQAVENALIEAQIRAMSSPGILSHHLRQKGVLGYDLDLAAAAREYNRDMASHLANLDLAPQMSAADTELDDYVQNRRDTTKGQDLIALQQLQSELHARIKDKHFTADRDGMGGRLFSAAMNVTYMRHLFSPHYTILQTLQPLMTTYPILAAKYGDAVAWREMKRFYGMKGGVVKALGKGVKETGAAALNLNPLAAQRVTPEELAGLNVHDQHWINAVAGEPDGAELQDLLLEVSAQGMGASSGIEAGTIAQQDMAAVERGIQRLQNVAKGMPESAEGINRAGAAVMTYRAARSAGKSIEEARAEAVNAVEQTQGGYGRSNSPWFFNHPVLKFPLQFRRYGLMFAQMYYGSITKLVAKDPETRKVARKQLARLSATTFLFAGIGGLPLAEVARTFINAAVLMGFKDDDWEKDEGDMQEWFSSMLGWASGSEGLGDKMSEAAMHGLTRLVGADTSSTMGADNLLTFGQPKTMDESGMYEWLGKMAIGASGKTVLDTYHAVKDLDVTALPWPKIMQNIMDGIELTTVGTVDPITGEQYMEPTPIYEGIIKGTGFKSASEAEHWEPGGAGYDYKQEKKLRYERRQIMERWSNATGAAKDRAREEAREFSQRQTDRKMRIDVGDLYRSKRERERQRKERQKKREDS